MVTCEETEISSVEDKVSKNIQTPVSDLCARADWDCNTRTSNRHCPKHQSWLVGFYFKPLLSFITTQCEKNVGRWRWLRKVMHLVIWQSRHRDEAVSSEILPDLLLPGIAHFWASVTSALWYLGCPNLSHIQLPGIALTVGDLFKRLQTKVKLLLVQWGL